MSEGEREQVLARVRVEGLRQVKKGVNGMDGRGVCLVGGVRRVGRQAEGEQILKSGCTSSVERTSGHGRGD